MVAERLGIRSVSIVGRGFAPQARAIGEVYGLPDLAIAEYPGMLPTDGQQEFETNIKSVLIDRIVDGLARDIHGMSSVRNHASRDTTAFAGDLAEIQEHFIAQGWTDGLPIVPPTLERTEAFLAYTDRSADEHVATFLPSGQRATVWSVAVNGVMAGCRPEYMPILLAVVDAIGDPEFRIADAGATPGWEPLVIVSGPIAKQLRFNSAVGAMRVGFQANTTVGRFLRLFMCTVVGLRIQAATTDRATIGMSFNVALAENEDAIKVLGWKTHAETRGFSADDNVVTVQSVVGVTLPIYSAGADALQHLSIITSVLEGSFRSWAVMGPKWGRLDVLLVMSPSVATVLSAAGFGREAIADYIHEHARIAKADLVRYSWQTSMQPVDLDERVRAGVAPAAYARAREHDTLPIFPWSNQIAVVLAGDPDRNQSKGYLGNHRQGPPVSKLVQSRKDPRPRAS